MLVHPSRTTDQHFRYMQAIETIKDEWTHLLQLPANDPDRNDLVAQFRAAYDDVLGTVPELPPFEVIWDKLPRAVGSTQILEVNTRGRTHTPPVDWHQAYGWILVGGQAIDRGFTVRELTVTYMPRDTGQGNADTLQQRARFFGYRPQA
jgi:hypothetical protein